MYSRVQKFPRVRVGSYTGVVSMPTCLSRIHIEAVPRQFVYDTSSTDISSTTVYQRVGQLYIQLLFLQIIISTRKNTKNMLLRLKYCSNDNTNSNTNPKRPSRRLT